MKKKFESCWGTIAAATTTTKAKFTDAKYAGAMRHGGTATGPHRTSVRARHLLIFETWGFEAGAVDLLIQRLGTAGAP